MSNELFVTSHSRMQFRKMWVVKSRAILALDACVARQLETPIMHGK